MNLPPGGEKERRALLERTKTSANRRRIRGLRNDLQIAAKRPSGLRPIAHLLISQSNTSIGQGKGGLNLQGALKLPKRIIRLPPKKLLNPLAVEALGRGVTQRRRGFWIARRRPWLRPSCSWRRRRFGPGDLRASRPHRHGHRTIHPFRRLLHGVGIAIPSRRKTPTVLPLRAPPQRPPSLRC